MEALAEQFPLDIHWRSFELRPAGSPPISEGYKQQILAARPRFSAAMREELGVEINSGPFGIDSRPALVGAKMAEAHDRGDAYHSAVFEAYWQHGEDISNREVLRDIAAQTGLPLDQFEAALNNEAYQNAVTFDVEQAHAAGITGVPALVFEEKYLVVGAHPTPALANMIQKVKALEADTGLKS